MREIVFLNGKFLALDEAKISALDPGFLSGLGLFETMRSYQRKIVYFSAHLQRIRRSCRLIGLKFPYPLNKLKAIIKKTVKINDLEDAYVRLTLWKSRLGTAILVMVRKYQPYSTQQYRKGFSAMVSRFRQDENSYLAQIKSTNRILYEVSFQEAKNKGYDESLILNRRGFITEGSRSNVFFIKDNAIFTPAIECGCLPGITRRVIFALAKKYKIKTYEGNFTLQDLFAADEAFLTNSLVGVMPLVSVGSKSIGLKQCARLTKFFITKYRSLLK